MDEFNMIQGKITFDRDSQSVIQLVNNATFHDRTYHIDINLCHFIRNVVEEGRIFLEKIDTDEKTTYILTKPTKTKQFEWCKTSLGLLKM